ncbi:MAG: hypothetical protein U0353_06190 [Sandaracinus sp.]
MRTRLVLALVSVLAACDATTSDDAGPPAGDAATHDARSLDGALDPTSDASSDPTSDAASPHDAATSDAATPDASMPTHCPVSGLVDATYGLDLGAFPTDGHPDVAVHVPDGFDACAPHGVVVFFHGFHNCVANVIGASPTECTPGAGARSAFALSDQLDAAGVNAILVAVEARYDEASSDPGALSEPGRLHDLLDELYVAHLSPLLGRATSIDDAEHVVLASHSGGYVALARCLTGGGLAIDEVELFDSLYGELATYRGWLDDNLLAFAPTAPHPLRFAMVFTEGGGTAANSRALGADLRTWLDARGDAANLLFDDTTATLDPPAFRTPMIVKHSALSHDGVVSYYAERFLRGSDLPPLP